MSIEKHISDEELTQVMDAELTPRQEAKIRQHLHHCWTCRARLAQFERAAEAFVNARLAPEDFGNSAGPASQLRAQLRANLPGPSHAPSAPPAALLAWRRAAWALPAALALVAPLALWLWTSRLPAPLPGPLPDARHTPGATRQLTREQVCRLPEQDEGRLVSATSARLVFAQYGIHNPPPRTYEVDYLISPSLGGSEELQNLWPLPYAGGAWTSRVKDALEDHLRRLVCQGQVDLAVAQREIAQDWISAYRKYFRTREPLAEHARFVKDSPWE